MRKPLLLLALAAGAFGQTATYPSAIATDAALRVAVNNCQTTLSFPMLSSDTHFNVVNASCAVANSVATIDNEKIAICAVVGNVVSVGKSSCENVDGRGFDTTIAAAHANAATVALNIDAWFHNALAAEVKAIETALGASLANVAVPNPLPINKGGTNAQTQSAALANLLGSSQVPITNGGTGAATQSAALAALLGSSQVPLGNGGTGASTAAGALANLLPGGSQLQTLRIKPNVSGTTYEFASGPLTNAADYNFPAQTPGGSISIGSNTITLTPCPLGVNGSDAAHYLRLSGGAGTAEAALMTGGTCTSGAASGTVIVTAANTHSGAWTVQSASSGIAEADIAIGTSNNGTVFAGAGTYNLYATVRITHNLTGAGPGQTIFQRQFAGTSDTILQTNTGDGFTGGYSLTVAGGAPTGGFGLHQQGYSNGFAENISVTGGYGGVLFDGVARGIATDLIAINGLTIGIRQISSGMVYDQILQSISGASAINFDCQSGLFHLSNFDLQNTGTSGINLNLSPTGTDSCAESVAVNGILDSAATAAINVNPGATAKVFDVNLSNLYITRISGSVGIAINQYAYSLSFEHVKVLNAGLALGDCVTLAGKNMRFHGIELLYNGAAGVGSRGIVLNTSPHTISIQGSTLGYDYNTGLPSTNFAAAITSDANPITDLMVIGNRLAGSSGGMVMGAGASANWTIVGNTFPTAAITLGGNETNLLVHSNLGIGFTVPSKSPVIANYIATETGANNAIAGTLSGVALAPSLTVTVKLGHTLQAGANTFNLNAGGAVAIKSSRNVANNIATAYAATGTITLHYDGTEWVDVSQ